MTDRWAVMSPSWLDEVFEIDQDLGSGLKTKAERLELTARRAILREQIEAFRPAAGNLTAPQLRVLHDAHWKNVCRASFYARHSYTADRRSAVSLFKLGLVTIRPDDEPDMDVTITADGTTLATTIWTGYEERR